MSKFSGSNCQNLALDPHLSAIQCILFHCWAQHESTTVYGGCPQITSFCHHLPWYTESDNIGLPSCVLMALIICCTLAYPRYFVNRYPAVGLSLAVPSLKQVFKRACLQFSQKASWETSWHEGTTKYKTRTIQYCRRPLGLQL